MVSVRVINYIPFRRLVAVSGLSNARICSRFHPEPNVPRNASYCTRKALEKSNVDEQESRLQVGLAEVVKENTKSMGYLGVIIGGVGLTGLMFYVLFKELFSSKSPNNVYGKALERCKKEPKVIDALGQPIKGYGEGYRRRNHISHVVFMKDGVRHMRMQFYVQGIRRRGTVTLEVQENESGDYVYRYLYVLIDDIMQTIIKLEDNRGNLNSHVTLSDFDLN